MNQAKKIKDFLIDHDLGHGLGNEEIPCSMAAINLATSGRLTDDIPDCMSEVIGHFIICTQDSMTLDRINSKDWKDILPLAAGTGRNNESERSEIIKSWLFSDVLPLLQDLANDNGFGVEWKKMTDMKDAVSCEKASDAGFASAAYAAYAHAAFAAYHAYDAYDAYHASASAAYAASAYHAYFDFEFWDKVQPENLLKKLIEV